MTALRELGALLPPGSFLDDEASLVVYSYDGALDRGRPDAVVVPKSVDEVRKIVAWCAAHKVPFTARGAGTNLSGGCIPLKGGVVIALAAMNRILEVGDGFAVVEPGCVNLSLQKELEKKGRFYAPDPASFKVSTIGGNAAENAGGPRCLKYGTTTNHVLAVEAVMSDGSARTFSLDDAGPELSSLLVGAEGTLGVITKIKVKTTPLPGKIVTLLAGFPSLDASIECVSAIIARGIVPRVLEALDRTTVESVETYVHAGYPKTEAVLLIELDGSEDDVAAQQPVVEALCREFGASEVRSATDPAQRDKLWEGRRGAYAAMARLAPNVMVEDGVVPRDKLPEIVRFIQERTKGFTAGLLFHAGDGNIHPNIAYDERDAELTARVKQAGHDILKKCVELGGSLSGEHGIGVDKREAMAWLFSTQTLDLFRRIKLAFDPDNLANPDKLFPLSEGKMLRAPRPLSPQAAHLRERIASNKKVSIQGSGSRGLVAQKGLAELRTTGLAQILDLDRKNFTLTVEAGKNPRMLAEELKKQNLYVRLPDSGGTLGGLLATKSWPGLREDLIGMRVLLGNGDVVDLGGKVVKNVAGYDVPRLMLGSWGAYGVILDVTMKLHSRQVCFDRAETPKVFTPNEWHARLKRAFDPENVLNPWIFGAQLTPA